MPTLSIEIYQSLMDALVARCQATGEPLRHLVSRALSDALGLDHATLFQISTGTALVEGVHDKAITVGDLRSHGDFGLGTFEGLDGEMVVLDGHFYQAHFDGRITEAPDSAAVPFAVVTNFSPQHRASLSAIGSIDALTAALDGLRRSQKSLLRGSPRRPPSPSFTCGLPARCRPARRSSKPRTASRVPSRRQSGTLVGFWSPAYTRMVSVAGWHFHFLSADRSKGGHLLGCKAEHLDAQVQDLDDFRLAMPETRSSCGPISRATPAPPWTRQSGRRNQRFPKLLIVLGFLPWRANAQCCQKITLWPHLGLATAIGRFHVSSRISPERGLPKATFSLFGGVWPSCHSPPTGRPFSFGASYTFGCVQALRFGLRPTGPTERP
jgi:acetolactate decarboxylase